MLHRRWLEVLAVVWLVLGITPSVFFFTPVGLVKGAVECFAPPGTPCFHVGHPYVLQGFIVLVVTLIGAAILWGQGSIRARGQLPPSAHPPRVNSGVARN